MTSLDLQIPDYMTPEQLTAAANDERPPKRHGFIAATMLLLLTCLLFPFQYLDPYIGTTVIGSIGAIGIMMAVLIKQRFKPHFTCESIFLLGTTVSFVAAPVLARLVSNDFNDWTVTTERRAVKDGYSGAILLVLLFVSIFLFVSSMFKEKRASRFSDGRLAAAFAPRTFIIFFLLAFQLWTVRSSLLATGSYYTLHRSEFQFQDARYSAWAQIDNTGPIILAFAWGAYFMGKARMWWVLPYTMVDLMWNFISGGRLKTIMVGIAILVTYIVYCRKVPWKTILISFFPMLVFIGFMDFYRYALRRYADVNTINVTDITNALQSAQTEGERKGILHTLEVGAGRLNDLDSIAAIYLWVPDQQPFLEGETYGRILPAMVPRVLWPDKPTVMMPVNEWFFRHEGGSSGTTVVGEGYLNFGVIGVVLAAVMVALLIRMLDGIVVGFMWNSAVLPVYVGILAQVTFMQGQPMPVWITAVIKMLVLTVLVHFLTRPRTDQPVFHPKDPRNSNPELYEVGAYGSMRLSWRPRIGGWKRLQSRP